MAGENTRILLDGEHSIRDEVVSSYSRLVSEGEIQSDSWQNVAGSIAYALSDLHGVMEPASFDYLAELLVGIPEDKRLAVTLEMLDGVLSMDVGPKFRELMCGPYLNNTDGSVENAGPVIGTGPEYGPHVGMFKDADVISIQSLRRGVPIEKIIDNEFSGSGGASFGDDYRKTVLHQEDGILSNPADTGIGEKDEGNYAFGRADHPLD